MLCVIHVNHFGRERTQKSRKYDVSLAFIRATANGKPAEQHTYTSIAYSQRKTSKKSHVDLGDAEEVATFKYFVMWDTFYLN